MRHIHKFLIIIAVIILTVFANASPRHGILPLPPSQATAVGFSTNVFYEGWNGTNSIDLNDTGAANFTWFPHNAWPNSSFSNWHNFIATPSSNITVSANVLTLFGTNDANLGLHLSTARTSTNSAGYIGQVFTGGFYIEARIKYDQSLGCGSPGIGGWPVFWSMALELDVGSSVNGDEIDIMEAFPAGSGLQTNVIEWANGVSTNHNAQTIPPDTNWHIYGVRKRTMAQNSGTGILEFYVDNIIQNSSTVTYTSGSSAALKLLDTQHFPLMIGAGITCPINVGYIAVWQ